MEADRKALVCTFIGGLCVVPFSVVAGIIGYIYPLTSLLAAVTIAAVLISKVPKL